MFTWICPKCGSEVPPSESDCPTCRARAAAASATAPVATPVPPAPPSPPPVQPVAAPPPPPPQSSSITSYPPAYTPPAPEWHAAARQQRPLSPTLVAVASAVGICALLAVLYLYVLPRSTSAPSSTSLESPGGPPSTPAAQAHPLAKYIEISGLRVIERSAGQVRISYIVINHSPADLPDLRAQITLSAAGKPVFEFPATIPSIGPYESKDLSATVKTQLRPYELPDWQALKPTFVIRSDQ